MRKKSYCPIGVWFSKSVVLTAFSSCRPSVPVPSASTSALAYGAYLGLSGNLRYQLVYGAERVMQQTFNSVGVVIAFSSLLRLDSSLITSAQLL